MQNFTKDLIVPGECRRGLGFRQPQTEEQAVVRMANLLMSFDKSVPSTTLEQGDARKYLFPTPFLSMSMS